MEGNVIESGTANRPLPLARGAQRLQYGRKLWATVHRTLGLFLGAIFVVVGLTGSILAFWQSIDEWLNKDIMVVAVPPSGVSYRPLGEIIATAKAAAPPGGLPERLRMPRHSGLAAAVIFIVPADDDLETDVYEVFVDPYTAKATGRRLLLHGDRLLSQPFIHIVMDFHWTLLLGYDRAYVVGIPAIVLFISLLSGLYLWWPRNGNWHHALTIKWRATPERITYDLHKTFGLYLSTILMVLLFSGISMIFKPQVRSVVELFSLIRKEPQNLRSTPIPGRPPLSLDGAAAIADKVFPDGELHWILLPGGSAGVYVVGKQADDEPNRASTNRNVTIDQYSGQVLYVQDRNKFSAGETFLEWQYPLHCGEAFGNAGRALIMVMGFVPLALYVTGFLRWRQKRRARDDRIPANVRGPK
ncbi:MAG TPA: PepSY-associated TM helix domain-containing protein [Methylocella sp.]|nr:PepSY-associated TM helix domain-containing protein [Methylocella sp.]